MNAEKIKIFRGYLESYLNIFWLRPGTAIWRTYDTMILKNLDWSLRPSLEVCCGDGINSFILCGGKFDIEFDAFLLIRNLTVEEFLSGREDMYDAPFDYNRKIGVRHKPVRKFDYGMDLKNNLLKKAQRLNLYDKLVCQNVNKKLCFKDKSVGLIYSNALYWMDNIQFVLLELRRVLKDNGKIIALLPSPEIKKHYIFQKYLNHDWKFCKILDMGRYNCIKHNYKYSGWEKFFDDCGLKIKSSVHYLSGRFIDISEIEIRPLSNVLATIVNKLSQDDRNKLKQKWIETLLYIIMPMVEDGFLCDTNGDQTFFMFELIKNKI